MLGLLGLISVVVVVVDMMDSLVVRPLSSARFVKADDIRAVVLCVVMSYISFVRSRREMGVGATLVPACCQE